MAHNNISGHQQAPKTTVGRDAGVEQNISFPQRLQALREKRRLSRRTLAELCGLSKNMISLYERGEKAPSVEALVDLADFFGVSTDYLLGRKNF